jgi:hypothetical protein
MINWKPLPGERWLLYSPIGLRLLDDITGDQPFGTVKAVLDRQDPFGNWQETTIKAIMTPSGNLTYPGLERHSNVTLPARHFRSRIEAEFYEPLYRAVQDGIEFDAFPYNDTNPPANFPPPPNLPLPTDVVLTPASNYPFPTHIPVLRGRTIDVNGDPVGDAVVSQGIQERVLTNQRGVYALPLRWVPLNVSIFIDASHPRTGRTGSIPITIPQDLGQNHDIQIT